MVSLHRKKRRNLDLKQSSVTAAVPLGLLATSLVAYYLYKHFNTESGPSVTGSHPVSLKSSVKIGRSPEEIYNYWRSFVQLPKVMTFLERVEDLGGGLTHWVATGPKGSTIEWDSEIVDDLPNERISWQSLPGSEIDTWGNVQFRSDSQGRGTAVVVELNFKPPGNIAGAAVGHFFKGLENAVLNQNLRNLKAYMETGEVPTNRRQNHNGQAQGVYL